MKRDISHNELGDLMETFALVGPSGSGKSHRALLVAHEHNIDLIIDDGLAIKGSQVIAGISAKKQPTKVGAIKTALFSCPNHAKQVREAIKASGAAKILILGTSNGMIEKIAGRLELEMPQKIIYINEIASEKEIELARTTRKKYGTHIVPAPTLAVKPKFSGILIKPFKLFHSKDNQQWPNKSNIYMEQTVVRPTFSYLGKFYIANSVMTDIIKHSVIISDLPARIIKVDIKTYPEGIIVYIEMLISGTALLKNKSITSEFNIPYIVKNAQKSILKNVEYMTSINVLSINVTVKSFYFND